MPTPQDDERGGRRMPPIAPTRGRRRHRLRLIAAAMLAAGLLARAAPAMAQVSFEQTVAGLSNPDPRQRLRAVRLLKEAGYPEAAEPLARIVSDSDDDLQLEAIAAELQLFVVRTINSRHRAGFVVEVRGRVAAAPIFGAGPGIMAVERVPLAVAVALAGATTDRNPKVALEALYALGALGGEVPVADRPALLAQIGPTLAGLMRADDAATRQLAASVAGRLYAWRLADVPVSTVIGDAVIAALNDRSDPVRETAMWALGRMRDERAVQALAELFGFYRKGPLAERALDALAFIAHPVSVPLFVEQLSGRNPTYRLIAMEGLARADARTEAPAVQARLRGERNQAIVLGGHFANVLLSGGSPDAIIDALTRAELRVQAFQYVSDVSHGRIDSLARRAKDPDATIRAGLADALGLAGDPAAVALLRTMTDDGNADVAFAARRAIARLTGERPGR